MTKSKSSQVVNPTEAQLLNLSYKQVQFLKLFFNLGERFRKRLFHAHATLADLAGCSVSTVKRMLDKLVELGLIKIQNRYRKSNMYHFSPFVYTPEFRAMMRRVFVAFSLFFPLYFLASKPVQEKHELVVSNINGVYLYYMTLFSYQYHYNSDSRVQQRCEDLAQISGAFPRNLSAGVGKKSRSSEAMHNPIKQSILNITSFDPTLPGKIELMIFSDQAIEYADKTMKQIPNARDPFRLFAKLAHDYSKANNLPLNKSQAEFLRQTYPYPEDAPLYTPRAKKESPQMGSSNAKRQSWTAPEGPSEGMLKAQADLDRKWKEYELSKGVLTEEDSIKRYVLPNLFMMPSHIVADLVARGKLPDCPETRKRIAEGTASPLSALSPDDSPFAKATEDRQIPTQPKKTDWSSMIGPSLEDHSTLGIFSDNGETDTQLPW